MPVILQPEAAIAFAFFHDEAAFHMGDIAEAVGLKIS